MSCIASRTQKCAPVKPRCRCGRWPMQEMCALIVITCLQYCVSPLQQCNHPRHPHRHAVVERDTTALGTHVPISCVLLSRFGPFTPLESLISPSLAGGRLSWTRCNKGPRPFYPGPAIASVATDNFLPSCGEPGRPSLVFKSAFVAFPYI